MRCGKKGLVALLIVLIVVAGLPVVSNRAEASTAVSELAHTSINNTVALYIGSHRAIVDNKFTTIDPISTLTKPIIQNARTLVPVRFIAENFGAEVGWDDATLTVPITLGDTTVVLQIGSRTMMLDGNPVTLDVTPIIHNKRTFLPLRAITEAFGKHVFYDRELIVVSDAEVLDAQADMPVVTELINWFKTGKIPVWQNPALTMQQLAAKDKSAVAVLAYKNNELLSQGSGFSLGNGLFATSLHVLIGADFISMMDNDGNYIEVAGVVGYDIDMDLAILRAHVVTTLPAISLGRLSTVKKGDQVVAIGSPSGLLNTVSTGIVSNIHNVEGITLIQITAPLAPGSSGGVLLNMQGQAVGVTFMGIEATDLNFVIPIDYLLPLYDPIKNKDISTIPLVELPEVEEPIVQPPTFKPIPKAEFSVGANSSHTIVHPSEPILYVADHWNQEVVAINYETQEVDRIKLSMHPQRMTFDRGELLVTLQHPDNTHLWAQPENRGHIAIIDPATFAVKRTLQLDIAPYDIVVDRDGYIYVSGSSATAQHLASFTRDGVRISEVPASYDDFILISPVSNRIYVTRGGKLRYYPFANGVLENNPSLTLEKFFYRVAIHPDGSLYLGSGDILDADLNFLRQGESFHWKNPAFDAMYDETFIPLNGTAIKVYEHSTSTHIYTVETSHNMDYLFYRNNQIITWYSAGSDSFVGVYPLD